MIGGPWRFDSLFGIRIFSFCLPEVTFGAIDLRHPLAFWACDGTASHFGSTLVALKLENPSQHSEVPGNRRTTKVFGEAL